MSTPVLLPEYFEQVNEADRVPRWHGCEHRLARATAIRQEGPDLVSGNRSFERFHRSSRARGRSAARKRVQDSRSSPSSGHTRRDLRVEPQRDTDSAGDESRAAASLARATKRCNNETS